MTYYYVDRLMTFLQPYFLSKATYHNIHKNSAEPVVYLVSVEGAHISMDSLLRLLEFKIYRKHVRHNIIRLWLSVK